MRLLLSVLLAISLCGASHAESKVKAKPAPISVVVPNVTTTSNYSITVTITPAITSVDLSSTTVVAGPANAGTVVGAVSVTTNPPGGTYAGTIVLSGTDAAKFALTNNGLLPCDLVIGTADIPAGVYAISLSATQ
jgi:hypothetical protein